MVSDEVYTVIWIGVPLNVICCFIPIAFKIFSLLLIFRILMMYLCMIFLWFILLGSAQLLGYVGLCLFFKLGSCQALFLQKLFQPHSLYTVCMGLQSANVRSLILVPQILEFLFTYFSVSCFFVFRLCEFYWSILTGYLCCPLSSPFCYWAYLVHLLVLLLYFSVQQFHLALWVLFLCWDFLFYICSVICNWLLNLSFNEFCF